MMRLGSLLENAQLAAYDWPFLVGFVRRNRAESTQSLRLPAAEVKICCEEITIPDSAR